MGKETWDNWTAAIMWGVLMVANEVLLTVEEVWPPLVVAALLLLSLILTLYVAKRLGLLGHLSIFRRWKTFLWLVIGLLGIYLMNALGIFLLILEHGDYVLPKNQESIEASQMPAYLLFLAVVCHAPVFEEVMMRGLIMGRFFKNHPLLGLVVSSLLFGALHMPTDLGSWVIYGGMGLVLGLLYWKTKHLELTIALHMLLNAIGFLRLIGAF